MKFLIFILVLTSWSSISFSQDLKRQIGVNLGAELNNIDEFSSLSINYTNERNFVSVGVNFTNNDFPKFKPKGLICNYRIYPMIPQKLFNLFFCAGLEFNREVNRYSNNNFRYFSGDTKTFSAKHENKNTFLGLSCGFGFQINFTKNFNFSASINNLAYYNLEKQKVVVQNDPVDVLTHSSSGIRYLSQMGLLSIGYNFNLKKEKKTLPE